MALDRKEITVDLVAFRNVIIQGASQLGVPVVGACDGVDGRTVADQGSQRVCRHRKFFAGIAGFEAVTVILKYPDELLETLWNFILNVRSDLDQDRRLLRCQQLRRTAQHIELVTVHIEFDEGDGPIDAVLGPHLLHQGIKSEEACPLRRLQFTEMFAVPVGAATLERPA
jgi:hypothetical protein